MSNKWMYIILGLLVVLCTVSTTESFVQGNEVSQLKRTISAQQNQSGTDISDQINTLKSDLDQLSSNVEELQSNETNIKSTLDQVQSDVSDIRGHLLYGTP